MSLATPLLIFSLTAPAAAQTRPASIAQTRQTTQTRQTATPQTPVAPSPTPTPPAAPSDSEDDVVRITSNLVQVDAVVTDKQGRLVTDLRPEDFEVLVEGKPQPITNFSFVSNESRTVTTQPTAAAATGKAADKNAPPIPPARLRPEQVRRTIALVVDDLGTSFESMPVIRQALRKFVDEQMQAGDLVAVMRTSAGVGALQQFTSDKRLLYAAIERVRWYPSGRGGASAFGMLEADPLAGARGGSMRGAAGTGRDESERAGGELDEFREEIFSVGTLGALNFIVKGLKELPGRKSIVMFSDGFEIYNKDRQSDRVLEALRRLTDLANRASVVIYSIDARGLPYLGLTAADNTTGMSQSQIERSLADRSTSYFNTQSGLNYLAQQTGGIFIRNSNDLSRGLRRVLDDQKGYYLIGYRPDESAFRQVGGRVRFNKFEVKLKRPGLSVRTRSGFYGFTEEDAARPVRRTRTDQLVGAITSPFASGDVPLRLTSVFSSEAEKANFVSSLMHIDVSNLKFADDGDGWRKAVLDVFALTFGENGNVVEQINRTENVRARGEGFEQLMRNGLVYMMKVPVKKPGAYQLRVAVRDAQTERIGAASQFVEVPDLKKDRLALSGLVMQGSDATAEMVSRAADPQQGGGEGQQKESDPMSSAAVRRFRLGTQVDYFFHIYNARTEAPAGRTQLQTQMRLIRDGQVVFTGTPKQFDTGRQTDWKRLQAGGRFLLGTELAPGEYVLQIIVTDALAKEKYRVASQWTDFEVVK
jgi:VWFA-related protein